MVIALVALAAGLVTGVPAMAETRQEILRQSGERAQRQKPASYTPSTKLRAEGARENYQRRQAAASSSRQKSSHSSSRSNSHSSSSSNKHKDHNGDDDHRQDDHHDGDRGHYYSHSRYYGYPRSHGYYPGYGYSPFFAAPMFSAVYSTSSYYRPFSAGSTLYYYDRPAPVEVYRGRISRAAYDQILAVQRALGERGYDTGGVDGIIGPRTRGAIRQFQVDSGLTPTGTVNTAVLRELGLL